MLLLLLLLLLPANANALQRVQSCALGLASQHLLPYRLRHAHLC